MMLQSQNSCPICTHYYHGDLSYFLATHKRFLYFYNPVLAFDQYILILFVIQMSCMLFVLVDKLK